MILAHDIYAETNPALCTLLIAIFSMSYASLKTEGPEIPLCYLMLPLVLSGDIAECFAGTNKATVLGEWLQKHPRVVIELADRVNNTLNVTSDSIRFGLISNTLLFSEQATINTTTVGIQKITAAKKSGETILNYIKHADRLGTWFAKVGSSRSVYEAFGVTL